MIKEGEKIPAITVKQFKDGAPTDVAMADYCSGRKVVLFAIPGAFTPTCSETHLPGYLQNMQALRDKGVDAVACISTGDFFVMNAWGKSLGVGDEIDMLADGNHEFTRAAGMTLDLSAAGLGERTQRYAMIIDDGVITHLAVEPSAGEATVSSAESVLQQL